jgi:hypothetical protein
MKLAVKIFLLIINLILAALLMAVTDGFYSGTYTYFLFVLDGILKVLPLVLSYIPLLLVWLLFWLIISYFFTNGIKSWRLKRKNENGKNHEALRSVHYDPIPALRNELPIYEKEQRSTVKVEDLTKSRGKKEEKNKDKQGELNNPFTQLDMID